MQQALADKPLVSLADRSAVINPGRMAEEFAAGAAVGGILGAGQLAGTRLAAAGPMVRARQGDYSGLMQELDNLIQAKKRNELLAEYEKHVGVLSEKKQRTFHERDSKTDSMLAEEQKKQEQRLNGIGRQLFAISSDVNAKKISAFRKELANGTINLNIREQKQNEHIAGTKQREFRTKRDDERGVISTYFYEGTNVESLIDGQFGTGLLMYNSENSMFPVEYITFEKPVGKAYNYGTKEWVDVSKGCS